MCRLFSGRAQGGVAMNQPLKPVSSIRRQAADALRRARRLPIGHDRNDLRQLALGLLWLEKRGFVAVAEVGSEKRVQLKETGVALISQKEPHGVTRQC